MEAVWTSLHCTISIDPQSNTVIVDWLDYSPSNEFRKAFGVMVATLTSRRLENVLNNTENLRIICKEDQQWVKEHLLPRLKGLGVKVITMVNSVHYWTRLGNKEVLKNVEPNEFQIKYFDTKKDALVFLRSNQPGGYNAISMTSK